MTHLAVSTGTYDDPDRVIAYVGWTGRRVLWGARCGDIQVNSTHDRDRPIKASEVRRLPDGTLGVEIGDAP